MYDNIARPYHTKMIDLTKEGFDAALEANKAARDTRIEATGRMAYSPTPSAASAIPPESKQAGLMKSVANVVSFGAVKRNELLNNVVQNTENTTETLKTLNKEFKNLRLAVLKAANTGSGGANAGSSGILGDMADGVLGRGKPGARGRGILGRFSRGAKIGGGVLALASVASAIYDGYQEKDQTDAVSAYGGSAFSGAASGAMMGMMLGGPAGAVVGGLVGLAANVIGTAVGRNLDDIVSISKDAATSVATSVVTVGDAVSQILGIDTKTGRDKETRRLVEGDDQHLQVELGRAKANLEMRKKFELGQGVKPFNYDREDGKAEFLEERIKTYTDELNRRGAPLDYTPNRTGSLNDPTVQNTQATEELTKTMEELKQEGQDQGGLWNKIAGFFGFGGKQGGQPATSTPPGGGYSQTGNDIVRRRAGIAPQGPIGKAGGVGMTESQYNYGKEMHESLVEKGWTHEQAAGLVARSWHESNLMPGRTGDGGLAKGPMQWHPDRQQAVLKATGIDVTNPKLSAKDAATAIDWELNNTEKAAGNRIRAAKTAEEAGGITSEYYIRPKDRYGESAKTQATAGQFAKVFGPQGTGWKGIKQEAGPAQIDASKTEGGLQIPVKMGGGTIKMVDVSSPENLRGQAFAGGKTQSGTLLAAAALQKNLGDQVGRFSAFNDLYHAGTRSGHAKGLKFDVTTKEGTLASYDKLQQDTDALYTAMGLKKGVHYGNINEARYPSARSSGPHQDNTITEEGQQFLVKMYNENKEWREKWYGKDKASPAEVAGDKAKYPAGASTGALDSNKVMEGLTKASTALQETVEKATGSRDASTFSKQTPATASPPVIEAGNIDANPVSVKQGSKPTDSAGQQPDVGVPPQSTSSAYPGTTTIPTATSDTSLLLKTQGASGASVTV